MSAWFSPTVTVSTVESDVGERTAVKSADRVFDVLEHLSRSGRRFSVSELSRDLGIPKSSLHGLLRTMSARGWLSVDGSGTRYGIGMRAVIASSAFIGGDDAVAATSEALDEIAAETGETVHLGRLDGTDIVYLAKRDSIHPLRLFSAVGRRLPAHATALGKVLLADLAPEEVDTRLGWPLERLTQRTIVDRAVLHRELAAIRAAGYAVDRGENAVGISCVAISVPGRPGNAISCSVPDSRMSPERVDTVRHTLDAALRIIPAS